MSQQQRPTMEEIQLREMWGLEHYESMGWMTPSLWDRLDRLRGMFRSKPEQGGKSQKRCLVGVKTYRNGTKAEVSLFPRSEEMADARLIELARREKPDLEWRIEMRDGSDGETK